MPEEKVVIATTKVINGIAFTRECLVDAAESFNGDRAIRRGLEHDPHYVPLGKTKSAEVVDLDEESVLAVIVDDTHNMVSKNHEPTGTRIVELTFPNDTRPFTIHGENTFKSALTVTVDRVNFEDGEKLDAFLKATDPDGDTVVDQPMVRRSLVPDPLIQFAISYPELAVVLTWIGWRGEEFLRYTVDQTLRKVGDDISEKVSRKIKMWLNRYDEQRAPHEQNVTSHLVIDAEPQIHLLTRTQEAEHNTEIGIESLVKQIELHQDLVKQADSITFARTTKAEDWKFLYLTSKSGNLVATEECYIHTLEALERLDEIARTIPICICMEHKETREEHHHETTAVVTSLSDDGHFQLRFNSYPENSDQWEITRIDLLLRD